MDTHCENKGKYQQNTKTIAERMLGEGGWMLGKKLETREYLRGRK